MQNPTNAARIFTAAGITLPKAAQEAIDLIHALREAARRDVAAEARAKVSEGKITAANAAQTLDDLALAYLRHERADRARIELEQPAAARFNAAIREHAEQLIEQMAKEWDKAAAVVHEAARLFPPDADPGAILAAGPEAAAAHGQMDAALSALARLRSARVEIADYTADAEQHVSWFIAGARDAEQLAEAQQTFIGTGNVWHKLAAAGLTLRLNTAAEASRVRAGARLVTDQRNAAELEARAAERRESWRGILPIGG